MIAKYNSFNYWQKIIEKNKTYRGRIFLGEPITNKTVYFHSIVFNRKTGIESTWAPIPSLKMLLGYMEYCFLPMAYERWIEGKDGYFTDKSVKTVEEVIKIACREKDKYRNEILEMKRQIEAIKQCWEINRENLPRELNKFTREFNKTWIGNNESFLYVKIFCNSDELYKYITYTNNIVQSDKSLFDSIGVHEKELEDICKNAGKDASKGELLKKILSVNLVDML